MSDPRFARFKTDPRFRRIKNHQSKVVVDDRFKSVLEVGSKKRKKGKGRVDKYGKPLADTQEQDDLRRFYRIEQDDKPAEPEANAGPDYARGAVLLESSDEEADGPENTVGDDESDIEGVVTLGRDISKPIAVPDEEQEIDLDENSYAELDAQAAAYAKANPEQEEVQVPRTRRLAVVNLDWDCVRATHLYRIFASLVSPNASAVASSSTSTFIVKGKQRHTVTQVVRGKVLSVRVYPSQFGKERMAKEEKEGPPPEVFKKNRELDAEEINERTIYETGDGEDYDEDMLRKYQLERLRYYYAVLECDTVEAASHIYTELEGSELERSANVFDLSFVPDNMTFDDEPRDEATDDLNVPYKGLEFVTDALRHSKVKLTWDEDDPERIQLTRRILSRREIDDNDFKAYIASSTSGSEDEANTIIQKRGEKGPINRDKLRSLLLGSDVDMPEGWNTGRGEDDREVDMEITFTPGLSTANDDQEETTLEKYKRKMKEKKKKRKEEMAKKGADDHADEKPRVEDDFFAGESDDESVDEDDDTEPDVHKAKGKRGKSPNVIIASHLKEPSRHVSTAGELALLASSGNPDGEPKHFDMKAVIKAEKAKGRKKRKKTDAEYENELQEDFTIDVKDERFKAVHEDYAFAIDPSNPHFKKTESMSALLEERHKRQGKKAAGASKRAVVEPRASVEQNNLKGLVDSVKRKSAVAEHAGVGKRRRI
ncbi:hypothetical protein BKA93DRAFT_722539 [Sparassis latifolia]|uniref:Pre-rRNA-processing protein n=1 Tax=Sparassis crispa TaxID=139825 RepID=A0A401G783_9APHY|nr:Pre-rRNA-processing protein [Sparassis crispa]GBE78008.1 Pre-rRNA-processing protein [Sparassis crispa]